MYVVLSASFEITTWVALLAVTLRVDELPCAMLVGWAAIATVGAVGGGGVAAAPLPQEVVASVTIAMQKSAE